MKRLLLLLAALAAVAALTAAAAAAGQTHHASLVLSTDATTITLPAGQDTTQFMVHGVLDDGWGNHFTHAVSLYTFPNATCAGDANAERDLLTAKGTGAFDQVAYGAAGVGSFRAVARLGHDVHVVSNCLVVTVEAAVTPPQPPVEPPVEPPVVPPAPVAPQLPSDERVSSYLCWNRDMANPVAYIDHVADQMWPTGKYLEPVALLGNVVDGTNIGAYHLVCTIPAGTADTGMSLGGSGEVYDAHVTALYHAEHADGNDLNIYHIWK